MTSAHQFNQLTPHVYWLSPDSSTDRPILGAIVGSRGTLLVDAGNSPAHVQIVLDGLARRHLPAPTFCMLTHWHWDHVFGASALSVPILAHVETRRIVTVMAGFDWGDAALDQRVAAGTEIAFCRDMLKLEWPDRSSLVIRPLDIGVTSQVDVDLGGVTARFIHVGGDHSPDSSVVYIPEDRIMFLSDCLGDDLHHGPRRLTTTLFPVLLDRVLSYEVDYYLEGHNPAPVSKAELATDATVIKSIARTGEAHGQDREAILAKLPQVVGKTPTADHEALVDAFLAGACLPIVTSVL
jgi:glyoxylase-like metal-dependent hydrolase (beta-lactamase superfamily II)